METLIVGIVALVVVILILKFAAKNIVKLLGLAVVLAGLGLYLFLKVGNNDKDIKFAEVLTEYTIDDLHGAYCTDKTLKADSLKCVCIIEPLYDDIHERFNATEIEQMRRKRIKFATELVRSYQNKKEVIKQKLKENKAEGLLDEFKDDIINRKFKANF